jgi:DNA topoisomerase-2
MAQYKKLNDIEFALKRPDTYIGSVIPESTPVYVVSNNTSNNTNTSKIIEKTITYPPGLYKIYDEIIVNAIDQAVRLYTNPDTEKRDLMTELRVNIDQETGEISIQNNGKSIEIIKHPEYNEWVPEIIFGSVRSSENYDDTQRRIVGGMNGLGAKTCNIFSKKFTVEIGDSSTKQRYIQTWENNMTLKNDPVISRYTKKDYIKISFIPDYPRFGVSKLTNDIVSLMNRRVYDVVAVTKWLTLKKSLKVYLNDTQIDLKTIKNYTDLFSTDFVLESPNEHWDVGVGFSEDDGFKQVSFVNGIYTKNGGKHVDYITDQIITRIHAVMSKKHKDLPLKKAFIRNHLFVFVRCNIDKPSFNSQCKNELNTQKAKFGSTCVLSDKFIDKIGKAGLYDKVLKFAVFKNTNKLEKTNGVKRNNINVPKYTSAKYSGTSKSDKCTLILTEGDSAKTLAMSGLSPEQRSYYGIFPLKGKLLNIRDISMKKLMENDEINNLKKILGLQHDKVYKDTKDLRYGRIMVMTDQDVDGHHIKGLVFNAFSVLWPSLFQNENFLSSFLTPIIRATHRRNGEIVSFYTLQDYDHWAENNPTDQYKIKYYKGLGTSTSNEAKEYFANLQQNTLIYRYTPETPSSFDLAFDKTKANDRKEWLKDYNRHITLAADDRMINLDDFIHKELIHFSTDDLGRSIPSVVDGLKVSQRKVLFGAFKRKLREEIKVSQFAGYVSEQCAYHHGEKSLEDCIISLTRNFVGSNNINLLIPSGQLGSRLQGGKDAASSRYIFTALCPITDLIFNKTDNNLLEYLVDDGMNIEPLWYIPIIPMILVNGARGIGTGFSTFIPNYNPQDIIENLERMIRGQEPTPLMPWYKNFNGTIEETSPHNYTTTGKYRREGKYIYITELPINVWSEPYVEYLESIDLFKKISHTNSGDVIDITIELSNASVIVNPDILKLTSTFKTSNMHLFDAEQKIKRYDTPVDILKEFYTLRLVYYQKRREYMLNQLQKELGMISSKVKFIKMVRNNELDIRQDTQVVVSFLKHHKFCQVDGKYEYLLNMSMRMLTEDNIRRLMNQEQQKREELNDVEHSTPKHMWLAELNTLKLKMNDQE